MLFDTHCHVQFNAYKDDREEVIWRSLNKQVIMNVVGTQIPTSRKAIELAEKYEVIYASVGIHPIQHDTVDVVEESDEFTTRGEQWDEALFDEMARHPKVIAIGETGLDRFHIRKDETIASIFERQKELFLQHYALADRVGKPMVIHVREAHDEMIEILHSQTRPPRATVHCFTGTWLHAQKYLDMGLYLGFTGVITFPPKKSDPNTQNNFEETLKKMPLDRIVVETDSPYLTPQIRRGQRNEPWQVEECVKKISEIRNISYDAVAEATTYNAKRLFKLL